MSYLNHMKQVNPEIEKLAKETAQRLFTYCLTENEEDIRVSFPLVENSFASQLGYEMVLILRKELRKVLPKILMKFGD